MLKYLTPHVASRQPPSARSHAHNFMEFSGNLRLDHFGFVFFLTAATQDGRMDNCVVVFVVR